MKNLTPTIVADSCERKHINKTRCCLHFWTRLDAAGKMCETYRSINIHYDFPFYTHNSFPECVSVCVHTRKVCRSILEPFRLCANRSHAHIHIYSISFDKLGEYTGLREIKNNLVGAPFVWLYILSLWSHHSPQTFVVCVYCQPIVWIMSTAELFANAMETLSEEKHKPIGISHMKTEKDEEVGENEMYQNQYQIHLYNRSISESQTI